MTAPTISVSTLAPISGYCAASGATTAATSGTNAASMTASHGSLRYHGRDGRPVAAGAARDSGARLGSACGSLLVRRRPVGCDAGGGSGRGMYVVGFEAACDGVFGAGTGRE